MKRAIAMLFLPLSFPAFAERIELPCPEHIETSQLIVSSHPGWKAASSDLRIRNGTTTHKGRPVGFSTGPAQRGAMLAPVGEGWPIIDGTDVWLVCAYADTTVQLSRPVPAGSRTCGIRRDERTDRYAAWCEASSPATSSVAGANASAPNCPAVSPEAISVLKPLMDLRNRQAADQFTPDGRWIGESPVSGDVESRFYSVLSDRSPAGDEALVYLLTVYMGEHPGGELVCEAATRGNRLLPLIRSYGSCQPTVGAEPLHKFVRGSGVLTKNAIEAIESGVQCDENES